MTTKQYKANLLEYLKGTPTDKAWELVAEMVTAWTEDPGDDVGDQLHEEIYGPPQLCDACESENYLPGRCFNCDTKLIAK